MKVSHRHQVHVQLTGREASLLLEVFDEFAESSRMENISDDARATLNTLSELLDAQTDATLEEGESVAY